MFKGARFKWLLWIGLWACLQGKIKLFRKNKIVKMRWKTPKNGCKSNENNQIQYLCRYLLHVGWLWGGSILRYIYGRWIIHWERIHSINLRDTPRWMILENVICKTMINKYQCIVVEVQYRGWSTWNVAINIVRTLCWYSLWRYSRTQIRNIATIIIVAQCHHIWPTQKSLPQQACGTHNVVHFAHYRAKSEMLSITTTSARQSIIRNCVIA